ncbi:hypothetical protein HEMROJRC1_20540 [Rodentibacter sp. JRC1]|uniref:hypothetical protein n=1 Tax=Rodentibacter sp. JRC1 TaxID=2874504 RepID=UPI001CFF51E0|nr:hypothetical protein [Rodentibacter sp. JRC1]GJI56942.1 hypothetical protein HEMROJRC1_20540 [Rodentibacter sp. JRC1]
MKYITILSCVAIVFLTSIGLNRYATDTKYEKLTCYNKDGLIIISELIKGEVKYDYGNETIKYTKADGTKAFLVKDKDLFKCEKKGE